MALMHSREMVSIDNGKCDVCDVKRILYRWEDGDGEEFAGKQHFMRLG